MRGKSVLKINIRARCASESVKIAFKKAPFYCFVHFEKEKTTLRLVVLLYVQVVSWILLERNTKVSFIEVFYLVLSTNNLVLEYYFFLCLTKLHQKI